MSTRGSLRYWSICGVTLHIYHECLDWMVYAQLSIGRIDLVRVRLPRSWFGF